MKICILGVRYIATAGGMYAYERNIKERLEARGHTVHIIAPEVGKEHRNDKTVHKAWVFGFYPLDAFIRKIVFAFTSFRVLYLLHKQIKVDLVYAMGSYGLNALFIRKLLGIPVVNHAPFPSMYRLKSERGLKKWAYLFPLGLLEYPALRFADKIIILSEIFRNVIQELCPMDTNKIVTIPNGVDIPEQNPDIDCANIRNRYGIGVNTALYLYVGWVTKKKGVVDLLKAYRMVKNSDKKLIVVGAIDKELAGVEEKDNYEDALFTGYVSEREKEEFFRCADIFVFPSHSEGQPFTVLEAMSYGLPVIATRKDGMVDQVDDGKTGFLVSASNPRELAEKMGFIAGLDYKQMGVLSREKAKREFGWTDVIDKAIRVFEEVTGTLHYSIQSKKGFEVSLLKKRGG